MIAQTNVAARLDTHSISHKNMTLKRLGTIRDDDAWDSWNGRSCKGLLAYAGLQRAMGKEPRCVGFKTQLPPNIIITEEDVGEQKRTL